MNEHEAYVALNMMERIGPVGVRSIVDTLGSVEAAFVAASTDLLRVPRLGPKAVEQLMRQRESVDLAGEVGRAEKAAVRIVAFCDPEYPECLRGIYDPPLALYIKGSLEERDRCALAVVGTRRPTLYGRETTRHFAYALAQAGYTITSGLAEGVDTEAHKGALAARGRTLAVIGSGFDHLYPASNHELADSIAEHGAVLSEFPFAKRPDRTTFPMRNRVVSGLSQGVLVVEAGAKSGALHTANRALEQGRSVFAVPGRIDTPASRGTNRLIQDGARCVTTVDDVLADYEFEPGGRAQNLTELPSPDLSEDEAQLVGLLDETGGDVDALIRSSGFHPAKVSALLMSLEMKRAVRLRPGRRIDKVTL